MTEARMRGIVDLDEADRLDANARRCAGEAGGGEVEPGRAAVRQRGEPSGPIRTRARGMSRTRRESMSV